MDDLDHLVNVFVGFRQLFQNPVASLAAHQNALFFELALLFPGVLALRTAVRDISRPAPWQTLPKVSRMAPSAPARTQDAVPMLPGTKTGWPTAR